MKKIYNLYRQSPEKGHYFSGYYDQNPFSQDNQLHLALNVASIDMLPTRSDKCNIGFFDLNHSVLNFEKITTSNAFNWQQGCKLQWLKNKDKTFCFVDFVKNDLRTIIFDINRNERVVFDKPFYSISNNGHWGYCIDYNRHYWVRRSYAFDVISPIQNNVNVLNGDGIWRFNFESGVSKQIIRISDLIELSHCSTMKSSKHYLEHLSLSPNDSQLAFLHRWESMNYRHSRLLIANADGTNLRIANDVGRISHFCWLDNNHIFSWGALPTIANRIRNSIGINKYIFTLGLKVYKKITHKNSQTGNGSISKALTGDSYLVINTENGVTKRYLEDQLDRDGHPSVTSEFIITDTYPDNNNQQHLLCINKYDNTVSTIDTIETDIAFNDTAMRCDLHPKISEDGHLISIDSLVSGQRKVKIYKKIDGR